MLNEECQINVPNYLELALSVPWHDHYLTKLARRQVVRFACGNSLTKVVRGHFPATAECHESVWNHPEKYFQPEILPDLQGLEPEWICARIKLNLNWLDIYPDEREIRAGENAIEVTHQQMTADIKKRGDRYYCTRIARLESTDPYWLALHLVHPDYLYSVVDEIVTARASLPDYF